MVYCVLYVHSFLYVDTDFLLPWEHYVCSKCLRLNPHAIWLVKLRCFDSNSHRHEEEVLVVIDPDCVKMTRIRHLPENYNTFYGRFWICRDVLNQGFCHQSHSYPHSQVECDSWNAKKTILQSKSDHALHKKCGRGGACDTM